MLNNYPFKPRGVIKWQAFAAVISGEEQKEEVKETPTYDITLLDDHLDQLDLKIKEALITNAKVKVKYLQDNQINIYKGYLLKVDYHQKKIIFDNLNIESSQIIEVEIIDEEE